MRSGGNIYDKTAELQWMAREQDKMTRKLKTMRTPKPRKPRPPKLKKPRILKPKIIKPLPVWRPEPQRGVKPQTSRPGPRSVNSGLIPPVNREAPIESLSKQREIHRDRLAQLATRPMPLRDLRTLITTELEHEHTVLNELGIQLHKELLKLQLEEGVLINMHKQSSDGLLSNADLVRVRPYKDPSKRELKKMERARNRQAARDLTALKRKALGLGGSLMDVDSMEHGDAMDVDQEPDFMRLNESYASRPIAPSQGAGEAKNVLNTATERGQRRVTHNKHPATTSTTTPIDVDMQEPDYAAVGGQQGQDEEAAYNSSDYEDEDEEQEEDGEEDEDEDEDEDEVHYEDEDEEEDDEDDEDDEEDDEDEDDLHEGDDQEDAARMALQQMLSMYGTG
ncbi:hypothetical protein BGZ68_006202 [Mortierella alpina]|nr:hypothetical protein BGZ68_006202 [Mortierella alpina]